MVLKISCFKVEQFNKNYEFSCKNPHFTADFLNIYAKFAYTRLKVFYVVFEELSDDIIFFIEK